MVMLYKYVITLPLIFLSGCVIFPDDIVTFCGPYEHGFIALNTNNDTYYKGASRSYDQSLYKEFELCSTDSNVCVNGPFYLNIDKVEYEGLVDKKTDFTISTYVSKDIHVLDFSSNEGLTKITFQYYLENTEPSPAYTYLTYEKCSLEIDNYYLDAYL